MRKARHPSTASPFGILLLPLAALLSSGCVTFPAVRAVASASQQASAPFREIAADMPASCLRAEAYRPAGLGPESACTTLEKVKPSLLDVQNVLDNYFGVLGQLASNQPVSFDKPFDQLTAAVKAGTKVPAAQIDAVDSLAKYLADLATRAIREATLKDVIAAQNGNVQKVLEAQKTIAGNDYRQLLENEDRALHFHFDATPQDRAREPLAVKLAEDQLRERLAVLKTRLAAIDTYEKALDRVAQAHQRLYDHRDDLSAKDLASALYTEARTLIALANQVEKAF